MKDVYKTPSAVVVILTRDLGAGAEVLLQRRRNTGFADGLWDFSCSGKVEEGESMLAAAVREANEELGVEIAEINLKFAVLVHKRDNDLTFVNPYFICYKFVGEPHIREPEKCSEIKWFKISDLPDNLIDDRRQALKAYMENKPYIEYGWNK